MSNAHEVAPNHLPFYLPGADGSDPLFTAVVIFLVVGVLVAGVLYFKLHSLPEHFGVKHDSNQLHLISVLALLALFTHNNVFWVLALLIAVIRMPDLVTPLKTMADSLVKLAASGRAAEPSGASGAAVEPAAHTEKHDSAAESEQEPEPQPVPVEKGGA